MKIDAFDIEVASADRWNPYEELIGVGDLRLVGDRLLNVKQAAELIGVDKNWVYANKERLGAIRLGKTPNAPIRFHPDDLAKALGVPRAAGKQPAPKKRPRRRAKAASGASGGIPLVERG